MQEVFICKTCVSLTDLYVFPSVMFEEDAFNAMVSNSKLCLLAQLINEI